MRLLSYRCHIYKTSCAKYRVFFLSLHNRSQESVVANMKALDQLIGLATKRSGGKELVRQAMEALQVRFRKFLDPGKEVVWFSYVMFEWHVRIPCTCKAPDRSAGQIKSVHAGSYEGVLSVDRNVWFKSASVSALLFSWLLW